MSGLPAGWVWSTVGEVAETSLGKMLDSKRKTGRHQTPYLRNINVRWGGFDLSDVSSMDIEPHELDRVLARPGDVIACEGGEPGRAAVWRGTDPVALQKALHRVRPCAGLLPDYLSLLLRRLAGSGELQALFTGTTIKHLPQEKLRLVRIPLPPLAEQARIVAAIEEAFSKLEAGEVGLRTVRQLLRRMREAVLAAAVAGRLLPQDPSDTPAARLLSERGLAPIQADGFLELPSSWAWAELGSLATSTGYGTSVKCGYDETGPGVVRIPNIQHGRVELDDLKRAPGSVQFDDDLLLAPGDLLLVRTNGSRNLIGRCAPVVRNLRCSFASYLIRFRLRSDVVSVEFVSLMLRAPWWRRRLEDAAASSAGQYNLSLRKLEPLPVALPPLAEQRRLVAEVERQLSFLDGCERALDIGLARAEALRRSLLKAAFEGRLVPQDAADEPASVLLERIQAERAANGTGIANRRRRRLEAS